MARLGSTYAADKSVEKFYAQRFRIWKKFDEGTFMTRDGWFSVTMEDVASHTAEHLASIMVDLPSSTAVDLFCGCGGNAIQLARRFPRVIAVDLNSDAIEAARHNAVVYGVADKIRFVVADVRNVAAWASEALAGSPNAPAPLTDGTVPQLGSPKLVVHASPPWGGVAYMHHVYFDVERDLKCALGMSLRDVLTVCWKPLGKPPFAVFLPRTVLVDDVGRAALLAAGSGVGEDAGSVQIECLSHQCNGRRKAITAVLTVSSSPDDPDDAACRRNDTLRETALLIAAPRLLKRQRR